MIRTSALLFSCIAIANVATAQPAENLPGLSKADERALAVSVNKDEAADASEAKSSRASIPAVTLPCPGVNGITQPVSISTGIAPWTVGAHPTLNPAVPWGTLANPTTAHPGWTAMLPPARWVQTVQSGTYQNHPGGNYYYRLKIIVPACGVVTNRTLTGKVAGDDAVFVRLLAPSNGPLLGNTSPGGFGFTPAKVFGITYTFTAPGTYILRARVINGPSAPNPSGLLLEGQIQ